MRHKRIRQSEFGGLFRWPGANLLELQGLQGPSLVLDISIQARPDPAILLKTLQSDTPRRASCSDARMRARVRACQSCVD